MYRLTPRMLQSLEKDLRAYHTLFQGGRCESWQLEELLVRAIHSDTSVNHHARWTEKGHDDLADIRVTANGKTHDIQVKAGKQKGSKRKDPRIDISGHRLTRFNGNFRAMTEYLKSNTADVLAVPCVISDGTKGRIFTYIIRYLDIGYLTELEPDGWRAHGKAWEQTNSHDVTFSLRPSMSWQIWWTIPQDLFVSENPILI